MSAQSSLSTNGSVKSLQLSMMERQILLVAGDMLMVFLAIITSLWLWTQRGEIQFSPRFVVEQWHWFLFLGGAWLLSAQVFNLYRPSVSASAVATGWCLLQMTLATLVVYLVVYFLSEPSSMNRIVVIFFSGLAPLLVLAWRFLYYLTFHRAMFEKRLLILGSGHSASLMTRTVQANFQNTYRVVGYVDSQPGAGANDANLHNLGPANDLVDLALVNDISEIVLAQPPEANSAIYETLMDCQEKGIEITPMPLLYERLTGRVPVNHISEHWFLTLPLQHPGHSVLYVAVKWLIDIVIAAVGLACFACLLPLIALAVKLDSRGPIFYSQARVGKGGRVFTLYKLRTMVNDAEVDQAMWCAITDPRVTRVGRALRRTHLDEIPQLYNILKGDMSLVGPRPERPEIVRELAANIPYYRLRHAVRPGATSWAFVHNGYARSIEESTTKLEYDLYYIKHQSVLLDLVILMKSVGMMLTLRENG